jgi:hypothetical protein
MRAHKLGLSVSSRTPSANVKLCVLVELLAMALAGREVKKIQNMRISGAFQGHFRGISGAFQGHRRLRCTLRVSTSRRISHQLVAA